MEYIFPLTDRQTHNKGNEIIHSCGKNGVGTNSLFIVLDIKRRV